MQPMFPHILFYIFNKYVASISWFVGCKDHHNSVVLSFLFMSPCRNQSKKEISLKIFHYFLHFKCSIVNNFMVIILAGTLLNAAILLSSIHFYFTFRIAVKIWHRLPFSLNVLLTTEQNNMKQCCI